MTGSCVTVTGKRVAADFFIASYNARQKRKPEPFSVSRNGEIYLRGPRETPCLPLAPGGGVCPPGAIGHSPGVAAGRPLAMIYDATGPADHSRLTRAVRSSGCQVIQ